jgi:hypothetical protein
MRQEIMSFLCSLDEKLELNNSEIANKYIEFEDTIKQILNNESKFKGLDGVEHITKEYNKIIKLKNNVIASEIINSFDEAELIKYFKKLYRENDIILRTNRKCNITIITLNGEITIERYVLRPKSISDYEKLQKFEGVTTIVPKDEFLGISALPTKLSVEAMLLTAKHAQKLTSYKLTKETIDEDLGINICPTTIMNVTNIVGGIAFKNEQEKAEKAFELLNSGKLMFPKEKKKGVLYIETDGAMFRTREKDDEGSIWSENKLGMIFTSDNIKVIKDVKTGEYKNRILKKEYTSYVGKSSEFKKFLFSCALRNNYGLYKESVLISDGAGWIKTIKDELFPDAQHILDFFHLKEKIYNFGKLFFANNKKRYTPWCEKICGQLRLSQYQNTIEEIEKLQKKVTKLDKTINLLSYLINNKNIIDYKTYREKGYFIGSGAIEGANKNILEKRMKQSGMRWNKTSVQSLVTLRSKYESGLWFQDVIIPTREYYGLIK